MGLRYIRRYDLRVVACLLIGGLLLLPGSCKGGGGPGNTPGTIAELKTDAWRDMIGKEVELEGYLLLNPDGTGRLLSDRADYESNGAIPEDRYVALGRDSLAGLDRSEHHLAHVQLRGTVRETGDPDRTSLGSTLGDRALCEVAAHEEPLVMGQWGGAKAAFINPCENLTCRLLTHIGPQKYALLYSGGINKDMAYMRYWNDMTLYYAMLTWVFGYDPDNIIVVYKDGVPENGYMPVHYAATPTGLNTAFDVLRARMDADDTFFLFMTNHGGTTSDMGSPMPNDEDFSADTIDETAFYYNQNSVIFDDDIAAQVNSLTFARMCAVMEQCFSGGMIYDLRGPNRVICTAANEVELSYGGAVYDDFVMLFASALIGIHQLTSDPVDADENNDGKVSIYEAFRWATTNDTRPEHPQYEDSGEGISIGFPSLGNTIDGTYGSTFFL